jgi:hypothetical protein
LPDLGNQPPGAEAGPGDSQPDDVGRKIDVPGDATAETNAMLDGDRETSRADARLDGGEPYADGASDRDGAYGTDGVVETGGASGLLDARLGTDGAAGTGGVADAKDASTAGDLSTQTTDGEVGNGSSGYVVKVPVEARHMVYDPARDRLYLTTTGSAAAYPNSVITVDPGTGAVVSSIWVGSQPSVLALSDDASTLWVGLGGLAAIRKISLSSGGAPVLGPLCRFPLDQNKIDYLRPGEMVVLPGAPESVVVVRSSTGPDDITVLDDCVARPTQVSHTNTAPPLIFRGPPGYLFGLNGSMNAIAVLPVDSSGITRQDVTGLIGMETQSSGFYHNGLIYMSGGEVVDVTNIASPARTGAFAFQGPIAPLDDGHVMMLNSSQLRVLSVDTFTQTKSIPLPSSVTGSFSDLTYASGDTVAFLASNNYGSSSVVLLHDPYFGYRPVPDGGISGGNGDAGTDSAADASTGRYDGGASDKCVGCSFTAVSAYGRHIVFDKTRGLIYVTADAMAKPNPSSVIAVDPTTGSVLSAVSVGKDPNPIALSDDDSTIWVGDRNDCTLQKLSAGTPPVLVATYPMPTVGTNPPQKVAPSSIAVLPATTSSVAVAANNTLSYAAFIIDDGVARPDSPLSARFPASFLVLGPPGYLYGYNYTVDFAVLPVTSTGVGQNTYPGLISGTNIHTLAYVGNLVFADDGTIVDVTIPDTPLPGGWFDAMGPIAVRDANHLLMLSRNNSTTEGPILRIFDTRTLACVATATLPVSVVGYIPGLGDMIYLGGDAVAFLSSATDSYQLFIMHAQVIGDTR